LRNGDQCESRQGGFGFHIADLSSFQQWVGLRNAFKWDKPVRLPKFQRQGGTAISSASWITESSLRLAKPGCKANSHGNHPQLW
jgi:hypothetical protein